MGLRVGIEMVLHWLHPEWERVLRGYYGLAPLPCDYSNSRISGIMLAGQHHGTVNVAIGPPACENCQKPFAVPEVGNKFHGVNCIGQPAR